MSDHKNQNNTDKRVDRELNIFEAISLKIEHEDNLFVGRVTWFVSLQGLLFFPVFFILSQTIENSQNLSQFSETFFRYQDSILLGLVLTGLSFCSIVLLGCQAGHLRINQLIELYRIRKERFSQVYSEHLHLILEVQSPPWIRFLGLLASFGSIFIFSKLWLYLEVVTDINQNVVLIISFVAVSIIDSITIHNLFDCVFDFLNYQEDRKFSNQVLLITMVIAIDISIYLYVIYNMSLFVILTILIVATAIFLLFALLFEIKLYIFPKEKYRKLKKRAVITNEKITMQNLEDISLTGGHIS